MARMYTEAEINLLLQEAVVTSFEAGRKRGLKDRRFSLLASHITVLALCVLMLFEAHVERRLVQASERLRVACAGMIAGKESK
jgi:hypothetical protein